MRYCSKCGAQIRDDARFCPSCGQEAGAPATGAPATGAPATSAPRRAKGEKQEKQEKGEKGEKQEKGEKGEKQEKGEGDVTGALVGGLVIIILGSLLIMLQQDYITDDEFGSYFLVGIGAVLMLAGVWRQVSGRRAVVGFFIGGAILLALGTASLTGFEAWSGALILVAIGVMIIVWGVSASRRNPRPP